MTEEIETPAEGGFKNRKVGLIIFGIVEICIGLICALFVPLMLIAMLATAASDPVAAGISWRTMVPGMCLYAALAAGFIWIGVGSAMARRWARALMLVFSWLWLITGVVAMGFWFAFAPVIYEQMAQGPQPASPAVFATVRTVMSVVMAIVYILLPLSFVLFYRSRHVRDTCRALDPKRRWTDNCPLPVLALVVMMASGLYSMLWMPCYNFVIPFFGRYLSGVPGALVWLCMTALLGALTRGLYKLRIWAWWALLALIPLGGLSAGVTMAGTDLSTMYEMMGIATEQVEAILDTGLLQGPGMAIYMSVASAVTLGYIVFTRRYFGSGTTA